MRGFHDDIERATTGNEDFRRVLYTGQHLQLVLMSLPPGCDIGAEVHEDRDQFFRFEDGTGEVDIDDHTYRVTDGSGVVVPAGARHNVRNTGDTPLKLYTIYGPPEHKDGITQSTKEEADARHHDEEWDGGTTEGTGAAAEGIDAFLGRFEQEMERAGDDLHRAMEEARKLFEERAEAAKQWLEKMLPGGGLPRSPRASGPRTPKPPRPPRPPRPFSAGRDPSGPRPRPDAGGVGAVPPRGPLPTAGGSEAPIDHD